MYKYVFRKIIILVAIFLIFFISTVPANSILNSNKFNNNFKDFDIDYSLLEKNKFIKYFISGSEDFFNLNYSKNNFESYEPNLKIINFEDGFGLTVIISNDGDESVSNIEINVKTYGGFKINPENKTYEIPLISAGESTDLKINLFGFGLGKIFELPEIKISIYYSNIKIIEARIICKIYGSFVSIIKDFINNHKSFDGYTLFTPEFSTNTYLINNLGEILHVWESNYLQGLAVYLLENGDLIRTDLPRVNPIFPAGGVTGRVEKFNWNGSLIWEFEYSSQSYCLHHDVEVLPNGNILMIAWEYKTRAEAINAGRNPNYLQTGQLWPDHIIEVEPIGNSGGNIVWEWHVWDHLIQDFDPSKDNYGVVAEHPELIDINYGGRSADWNHINSIDYNEELDQILLSSNNQNEIWIIDHSTSITEAADHTGGRYGRGGDLLYRWGNPESYDAGDNNDQKFFSQHDAHWIESGLPGEGNILVFNNGVGRPDQQYSSSVDEIIPPMNEDGYYNLTIGSSYGPDDYYWRYISNDPYVFFSDKISGAQRLPNGNTLICDGSHGFFFEVTNKNEIVWEYTNDIPNQINNEVFNIRRYAPDYPGLKYLS